MKTEDACLKGRPDRVTCVALLSYGQYAKIKTQNPWVSLIVPKGRIFFPEQEIAFNFGSAIFYLSAKDVVRHKVWHNPLQSFTMNVMNSHEVLTHHWSPPSLAMLLLWWWRSLVGRRLHVHDLHTTAWPCWVIPSAGLDTTHRGSGGARWWKRGPALKSLEMCKWTVF